MDLDSFRKRLQRFLQAGDQSLLLSDPEGLANFVSSYSGTAQAFVDHTLAAGSHLSSTRKLQEAAYVALMLREVLGRASAWFSVAQAARKLSILQQETIASMNLLGDSDHWIDADERTAAKEEWLCNPQMPGYCDHCTETRRMNRGEGYLLSEGLQTSKSSHSQIATHKSNFQFRGSALVCETCFRATGGVPKRCALPDERPKSEAQRLKFREAFETAPPDLAASGVLGELEQGKMSLPQFAALIKEKRKPPDATSVLMQKLRESRVGESIAELRLKRGGRPRHSQKWIDFHNTLQSLAGQAHELQQSQPERSLLRARGILILSRVCPTNPLQLRTLANLTSIFLTQKAHFEAIWVLEDLYQLCHDLDNRDTTLVALELGVGAQLVDALLAAGKYAEALDKSLDLSARAAKFGDRAAVSQSRTRRADIYRMLGDYEHANDCDFAEGRPLNVEEERKRAVDAREAGRYEEAIAILLDILERTKSCDASPPKPIIRSELGFAYGAAGNFAAAIRELEIAICELEPTDDPSRSLIAHWTHAVALFRSKESSDNSKAHGEASEVQSDNLETELNRAGVLAQSEDPSDIKEAETIYRRIVSETTLAESERENVLRLGSLVNLGLLSAGRGKEGRDEASHWLREAAKLQDSVDRPQMLLQANTALATFHFHEQNFQEAQRAVTKGLMNLYDIFNQTEDTESRQQVMAQGRRLVEIGIRNTDWEDEPLRPFVIAELVRARNMSRWLRAEAWAERISNSVDVPAGAVDQWRCALRCVEVELEASHFTGKLDGATIKHLRGERLAYRGQLDKLAEAARANKFDWKAHLGQRDLSTFQQDLFTLGAVAVVSLASTEVGVLITIVNNEAAAGLSAESWFSHSLRRMRTLTYDAGGSEGQTGTALWQAILVPICRRLTQSGSKRVLIISDRELALLPYWSIVDNCPCVEEMTVVPSLDVILRCEARRRSHKGATTLISDVTGTLPFAKREIRLVSHSRPASDLSENLSTHAQLRQSLAKCSLLHVAGHGVFWPQNPYESGVPISHHDDDCTHLTRFTKWPEFEPEATKSSGSYRLMTVASAMAEVTLGECRLAVLSTCESGIPRQHDGGELLGLPNALLTAGAKSVIASLWKVDDRASFLMMKFFYDAWAGGHGSELGVARALALARKKLRETTRTEAEDVLHTSIPSWFDEYPFRASVYSDAFHCFGAW